MVYPPLLTAGDPQNANTSEKKSGLKAHSSCKPERNKHRHVPAKHAVRRAARDGKERRQTRMSWDLFPREVAPAAKFGRIRRVEGAGNRLLPYLRRMLSMITPDSATTRTSSMIGDLPAGWTGFKSGGAKRGLWIALVLSNFIWKPELLQ
jgi:hypothetical protein